MKRKTIILIVIIIIFSIIYNNERNKQLKIEEQNKIGKIIDSENVEIDEINIFNNN